MFWHELDDGKVKCELCHQGCRISEGKTGFCGVRKNIGGKLHTLIYGQGTSAHPDPIEKKPLYHFHPGTLVMSYGTVGCNFRCPHCQNYSISQTGPETARLSSFTVNDIVRSVKNSGSRGVAWTYNEPTIWYEFTYDASKAVKEEGYYSVYVTNGYIREEPLKRISPYLDAMNIDVKAGEEDFYKKICKGRLNKVLETCRRAHELDILVELTYLIIPDMNDSEEEIEKYVKWVVDNLSSKVALHFSRFHPDYRMRDRDGTPMKTMLGAYETARKAGAEYVYLGNVRHGDYENTFCPNCGTMLVERFGFSADVMNIEDGKCSKCKTDIPIVGL